MRHCRKARYQTGAALITGLVLLLVLTLIGVTAMRSTTLEERMARNLREANIAFQMAETGLIGGESWVNDRPSRPIGISANRPDYANNQIYGLNHPHARSVHTQNKTWWNANATSLDLSVDLDLDGDGSPDEVASTPLFTVEEVGFVPDSLDLGLAPPPGRMFYRISATGVAAREETQAIVQSTFAQRL
ncbi:MAG: pilus assembly PilX family protein [Gammaproteobacteria bacterium]